MSDSSDWKQKYRDAVLEMAADEKRWRQIELALRRLIGRLCAAALGVDSRLDTELLQLAAANRRNAAAEELERLAEALTVAVVAVDAADAAASTQNLGGTVTVQLPVVAARWESTNVAIGKILGCLNSSNPSDATAAALIEQLSQTHSDQELAHILEQTAGLVHAYCETLARERIQTAAVLGAVKQRLEEVSGFLAQSGQDARSRFDDSSSINENVMTQVRDLRAEMADATELKVLQTMVSARLETVTQQVLAFRSREENRMLEQTGRADRMRTRIADLERETLDLSSQLDQEKNVARLDPLTRLANRKSFDERVARELSPGLRATRTAHMLVWDIDNFKLVNDTYGHRAGDRVLQSVAKCFSSGLRGEDFVARIGGEEFVVLLAELSFAKAREIADELRRGVEALRFHFRGTPVRVTVSCGLTELKPGDTAESAFDRADAALYRAKNSGKNTCIAA